MYSVTQWIPYREVWWGKCQHQMTRMNVNTLNFIALNILCEAKCQWELWKSYLCYLSCKFNFRWYATLENNRSHRNPPITASGVTFLPSLCHAIGLWLVISIRSVNNIQDWRKFWKHFRRCFVFQSRISTKTVVRINLQILHITKCIWNH